jgi:hypothetical protein
MISTPTWAYVPIKALYDDNWWFEVGDCATNTLEDDDEGNSLEQYLKRKKHL